MKPVLGPNAFARQGYLAGGDELRAADLNAAFADPAVRGIVCTRGGYGAQRVVDMIDMSLVRADPKMVAGFSDITALHFALWRGARLAGVHGLMAAAAWHDEAAPPASAESLRRALMTTDPVTVCAARARKPSASGCPVWPGVHSSAATSAWSPPTWAPPTCPI